MTGKQSTGAAQSTGNATCPSCGSPIVLGDPRCGTCRALLPAAMRGTAAKQESTHAFKTSMYSGGTTVATGMTPEQRRMVVIGIGVAVGAVLALAIVLVFGGGNDPAAPAAGAAIDSAAGQPGADQQELGTQTASPGARPVPLPQQQTAGQRASTAARQQAAQIGAVARELTMLLRKERLWSAVMVDRSEPNVLIIQSSLCDDPGMRAAVARARGDVLKQGEVAAVRCMAPHGDVVFETRM